MKYTNYQNLLIFNTVNNLVVHGFEQCLAISTQEQVFIRTIRKLIWIIDQSVIDCFDLIQEMCSSTRLVQIIQKISNQTVCQFKRVLK